MRFNAFGNGVQLLDAGAEGSRNHLQKATGAGRAFVIHQKVAEVALRIQLDDFAVLAADINNRAGFRRQQACAEPVTGNLRHLFIGKINQLATIAGEG